MGPSYPVDFGMAQNSTRKPNAAPPNNYRAVHFSSYLTQHSPRQSPSNDGGYGRFLPKIPAQNAAGPNPGYGILGPPPKGLKPIIINNHMMNRPNAAGPRMFHPRGGRQQMVNANRMRFRQPYNSNVPMVTRGGVVKKRPAESVASKLVKKAKSVLSVVNFPISSSQRIAQLRKKYKESVMRKRNDGEAWEQARQYPGPEREPDPAQAPYYYNQEGGRVKSGGYESGEREHFGEAYRKAHPHEDEGADGKDAYEDRPRGKANAAAAAAADDRHENVRLSREKQLEEQISRAYAEYYKAIQQDMESERVGAGDGPPAQNPSKSAPANASAFTPASAVNQRANAAGYQSGKQLPNASQNVNYPHHRYYRYGEKPFLNRQQPKQVSNDPSKSYPVQQRQANPASGADVAQSKNQGPAKPKPFSVGYLFQQNLIPEFTSSKQQNRRRRGSRWGESRPNNAPYWAAGGAPRFPSYPNAYPYQNYPFPNRGPFPTAPGNYHIGNPMYQPQYAYREDTRQVPPYVGPPEDGQEGLDDEVLMFDLLFI